MSAWKLSAAFERERIMFRRSALRTALAAAAITLCGTTAALARDSSRYVCSAVAEFRDGDANSKIGISIDFYDSRAPRGDGRKYVLSSIYQSKLFQGSMIDRSDKFGEGSVALKNGRTQLYAGSFKLEQKSGGDSYVMSLDGKISDDPTDRGKAYPVKATLPCVDLSI
jgi:hypothetical protein